MEGARRAEAAPTTGRVIPLLIAACALAGAGIATYLTIAHYANAPLACTRTGIVNCDAVTHSSFSVIPGTDVPITVPGLIWFLLSGLAALLALRDDAPSWLAPAHALLGAAGVVSILYLVYAELVVIHGVCEWCTAVHVLVLATFLLAFSRWQRSAVSSSTT